MSVLDSSSLLAAGLGLATRATVLFALALAAWLAVGRRRPLLGSAIGQAGVLGLLLLPALAWLAPPLLLPLVRAERVILATIPMTPTVEADQVEVARDAPEPADDFASDPTPPMAVEAVPDRVQSTPAPAPVPIDWSVDAASVVVAGYGLVAVMLLARLLGSLVAVARIRRSSVLVDDPAWLVALDRLRGRLGIRRPVRLARSTRVSVPAVVGWLRPMILLPDRPTGEHAEAILLHELAHVRRGDYAWNVLLRIVGAIYWPHPLAWLLSRVVAESRERACDAFCVHQMGGPSAYRAALLAMAEGLARRPSPALGLAMATPSRLGRRVVEIDSGRSEPRCLPRWPGRLVVLTLALASTAIVGPARITRAEPEAIPPPIIVDVDIHGFKYPAPANLIAAAGKVFKLQVIAADTGKPVPKADVRVWMGLGKDDWRKTDEEGRLDVVYATSSKERHFSVDVWGDGYAQQRHRWGLNPTIPIPEGVTIKLQRGESLGGLVQDEDGRPIADAEVLLWSHNYKHKDPTELLFDLRAITGPDGRWHTGGAPQTTGNLLGLQINHPDYLSDRGYTSKDRIAPSIEELRAAKAVSVMKKGVPIDGRVVDVAGKPVAGALVISMPNERDLYDAQFTIRTDADGRFRTGQVKAGEWHLIVKAEGHAPAARKLEVGKAIPFEEFRLEPPHSFRARVVDPEGKPIEGVFVNVDTWRRYRFLGVHLYTDADGWVRWDDAPDDELTLNIDHPTHLGLFQIKVRAGSDLVFTLKPSLAIAGAAWDARTRKAIAEGAVQYGPVDPKTGEVASWRPSPEIGWTWFYQGQLNIRFAVEAEAYKFRILAEGYQPFVSRAFRREEQVVLDYQVNLTPGLGDVPLGTVIRPDGRPLVGARVYRARRNENLNLYDGQILNRLPAPEVLTDAEGKFAIPELGSRTLVLILGDDCFAYANVKALADSSRLQARAFSRVEGRFVVGDRPRANWPVHLTGMTQDESTDLVIFALNQTGKTDADGRFTFEKVIAMPYLRASGDDMRDTPTRTTSIGEPVHPEDGQTVAVTVGGKGRPVIGRVDPPLGWDKPVDFTDRCRVSISTDRVIDPYPLELFRGKTTPNPDQSAWSQAWRKSPKGQAYADARVALSAPLAPDGSFRVEDVPPGDYRVTIRVNVESHFRPKGQFALRSTTLTIPPIPGGRSDEPVDLGPLRLKPRPEFKVGDPAPVIQVVTVEGKTLNIPVDFPGKFILLDCGASWQDQARFQIYRLNDVFARFGKNERFAMVSLLFDPDRPDSRAFIAGKGQPWPQAIVGAPSNPIADAYGIEADQFGIPDAILIGPDGRIVARDLFYDGIGQAVAKALGIQEPETERPRDAIQNREKP